MTQGLNNKNYLIILIFENAKNTEYLKLNTELNCFKSNETLYIHCIKYNENKIILFQYKTLSIKFYSIKNIHFLFSQSI